VLAGATDLYGARHGLHGAVELAEVYERLAGFLDEIRDEIEKQAEERLARWETPLRGIVLCGHAETTRNRPTFWAVVEPLLPKEPPKSPRAAKDRASTTGGRAHGHFCSC
jgi:hypothetical protein